MPVKANVPEITKHVTEPFPVYFFRRYRAGQDPVKLLATHPARLEI